MMLYIALAEGGLRFFIVCLFFGKYWWKFPALATSRSMLTHKSKALTVKEIVSMNLSYAN